MLYIVVRELATADGKGVEILEVYTSPVEAEAYRRKCQDSQPKQSFHVFPKKIKT